MLAHDYATAVAQSLVKGDSFREVLESLNRVLEKKGHTKLRARILRELERHFLDEGSSATLTLATTGDVAALKSEIDAAKKELGITEDTSTIVDNTIVGGFILETKDQVIDRSYKGALLQLYRRIIST